METVVCQSYHRDPPPWVARCLQSVEAWAARHGHAYAFEGDALFDRLPGRLVDKTAGRAAIQADVARLLWARDLLDQGADRVVWLDADVFVVAPEAFRVPVTREYAFGRETWVQGDGRGRFRVRRNVHNAACVFVRGNSVLDFLIHAALSVLERADPRHIAPQMVGPKLLTALDGIVGFPLWDDAGMLAPPVLADVAAGGPEGDGPALARLRRHLPAPLNAANLCLSLVDRATDGVTLTPATVTTAMDRLAAEGPVRPCNES